MNDNELDEKIKKALEISSTVFTDESSVAQEVIDVFKGRYRWLMIYNWIRIFLCAGFMLYFIYQFFREDDIQMLIAYATAVVVCVIAGSSIILFFFQSVNQNAMKRELKRLELQLALLIKQLELKS